MEENRMELLGYLLEELKDLIPCFLVYRAETLCRGCRYYGACSCFRWSIEQREIEQKRGGKRWGGTGKSAAGAVVA